MKKPRINECGHPDRKHFGHGMCKSCIQVHYYRTRPEYKVRVLKHVEKRRASGKNWAYYLNKNFGLSEEQYEEMLRKQDRKCAICGTAHLAEANQGGRRLCVDHDHRTGANRGLLCTRCNHLLGYYEKFRNRIGSFEKYLSETTMR